MLHRSKGFTLIEIAIVLVIIGLLLLAVAQFIASAAGPVDADSTDADSVDSADRTTEVIETERLTKADKT